MLIGSSVVFGYAAYFFSLSGDPNPFNATLVSSLTLIATYMVALYALEKVGRRRPSIGGQIICGITLFLIGGVLYAPRTDAQGPALIFLL